MRAFNPFTILAPLALAGAIFPAVPPAAAIAGSPSYDCAKADSRAERMICGDSELARMDVEATRVFRLIRDREGVPAERKKSLNDDRAHWMKLRDDCWISEDFRRCIVASYAVRIHRLREDHRDALAKDDGGITRGPVAMRCDKLDSPVMATFISSDPPVTAVELPERVSVGISTGTEYLERSYYGDVAFWTKGQHAFLKMPDGDQITCRFEKSP